MALSKEPKNDLLRVRVTPAFKKSLERATAKAQLPSVAEFVVCALMEKAESVGVKINRYK